MTGRQSNSSKKYTSAQMAEQAAECWRLRTEYKTEREISEITGIPLATVHRRLAAAFEARVSPHREQVRAWEDDRLDRAAHVAAEIMETAEDPEVRLKAADRLLKISERRSHMHGADEPVRSIVANVGDDDPEMTNLIAQFRAELSTGAGVADGSEDR